MTGNLKEEELRRIARRINEVETMLRASAAHTAKLQAKLNDLYAEEIDVEST